MGMENLSGKKEKKILVFYQKEKNGFGIFFGNIKFFCQFWKNGKQNGFRKFLFLKEMRKKILF